MQSKAKQEWGCLPVCAVHAGSGRKFSWKGRVNMKNSAFKPKISLIDSFIMRDVFSPVHESLIIHSVLLFFQSLVHRAPQETNSAVPD